MSKTGSEIDVASATSDAELPDTCTTKEAAAALGVSHRTVQLWVEAGKLKAWKTAGGHRRIARASLQAMLVERHGGEPQAAAPATPATPATAAARAPLRISAASHRPRVVVAEGDRTLLDLCTLQIRLCSARADVVATSNGIEALLRMGERVPDLLISSLNLPGLDSSRMIRTLRETSPYSGMRIVVLSELDQHTVASMGLPDDIPVLQKPIALPQLERVVKMMLS